MDSNTLFWDELAIQSYKKILKNKPNDIKILNHLGLVYLRQKAFKKAINLFKKVIKQDSNSIDAYYHIATAYEKLDERELSLRFFKKYHKFKQATGAVALDPYALIEQLKKS